MTKPLNFTTNTTKSTRGPFDSLEQPEELHSGVLQYPTDGDNFDAGHFIMFHVNEQVKGTGIVASAFQRAVRAFSINPFAGAIVGIESALTSGGSVAGTLAAIGAGLARLTDPVREATEGVEVLKDNLTQTTKQLSIIGQGKDRIQARRQALASAGASTAQLVNNSLIPVQMETAASILLYMPEKITTNYGFDYQGEDLSFAVGGLGLADILSGGGTLGDKERAQFIKGLGEKIGFGFATKIVDEIASVAGINVGSHGALEKKRRRVINPHMQFLFRSVNQRSFEYNFSFAPRNEKDSIAVDNIIRTFKFFAHPEIQKGGVFHGYPAEFDIQYIARENKDQPYAENDWLNKVGRCYLSGVAVDYSAAGIFSTFRGLNKELPKRLRGGTPASTLRQGNPPTHVNLTLTFNELETLNRSHIAEGF